MEAASPLDGEEEVGLGCLGWGMQPLAPAFCLRWAGTSPINNRGFKHNQMWEMKLLNSFCALSRG